MRGLFHPVIGWELLRELRQSGLYWERFFVAVAGSALGMFSVITGDPEFHQILFLFAGAFAFWKTLSLTMSAFAEERRNGTLGLLFLTGLSALGKFFFKPKRFQSPIRLYFKPKKIEKVRHSQSFFYVNIGQGKRSCLPTITKQQKEIRQWQ